MGETLTCSRCGASAPAGEWGFHGSAPPQGLAARFCPACGRASVPGRGAVDGNDELPGQMTVGEMLADAGATIAPVTPIDDDELARGDAWRNLPAELTAEAGRAALEGDRADWTVCDLCGRRGCDCSLGGDAWL